MANTLVEQSRAGQELLSILTPTDNMLKAYVNEYGDRLMKEMLEEDDEVVEGELIEEPEAQPYDDEQEAAYMRELYDDEETEEAGLAGEDDGLDPSEEEPLP